MSECTQSLVGGRLREDPKYDDSHTTPGCTLPVSLTPCATVSTLPCVSTTVSPSTSPSQEICKVSTVVLTRQNFSEIFLVKEVRGEDLTLKV